MTRLEHVLGSAKCVIFDFDGPVCRLFAAHPAADVARRMNELLEARAPDLLDDLELRPWDPHRLLAAARAAAYEDTVVREAEAMLTESETMAAGTATPTPGTHELIVTLHSVGHTLAVASNNSPVAIHAYLKLHGLADLFSPDHVHGRRPDAARMKPDPDCLLRVLKSTGAAAEHCVMIGDSPSDWQAAEAANIPFLGYARNQRKAYAFATAGAPPAVDSMETVLRAVRGANTGEPDVASPSLDDSRSGD